MKYLGLFLAVVYLYKMEIQPFYCTVKYKKQGTSEIKTEHCPWSNEVTLKAKIEELTGEEVTELIPVESL